MADMYLYNGLKLPKLPEWNEGSYPYAVIISHSGGDYSFVATKVEVVVSPNGYTLKHPAGSLTPFDYGATKLIEAEAESWGEVTYTYASLYSGRVIWANFDIQDDEGNTYLAASTPVPVNGIDHTAFIQGWIVGKRLAGMRGKQTDAETSVLGAAVLGTMILGGE